MKIQRNTTVLGMKIREARQAKNLRQGELAALLGVSRPAIVNWETGRFRPRAPHILKMEALLGVELLERYNQIVEVTPPAKEWRLIDRAWDVLFGIGLCAGTIAILTLATK